MTRPGRGNLIVGQSGGPTAVINSSLAGVLDAAWSSDEVDRVFGMRRGVEGLLRGDIIGLEKAGHERARALRRTPGAGLGACRRKITDEEAEAVVDFLQQNDVRYFLYIGGNDSADTTHRVAKASHKAGHEVAAVAIPKTIDNDLPDTDHCPGFGSIARYVATAALETSLDTRSLPTNYPVKILEVMGRDAGWVAAASALARFDEFIGPHLIYVPELPFETERFLSDVALIQRDLGYVVVAVAETVRDALGQPVGEDVASVDDFGHPIMRGTAESLVRLVEKELGMPARFDKPGALQRSSGMLRSAVDEEEAYRVGVEAVRLALDGLTDRMVTIDRQASATYTVTYESTSLDRVVDRQRLLPSEFLSPSGTEITDAFREWARPLLGPDPFPAYAYF